VVKTESNGPKQTHRPVVDVLWHWRAELLWGFAVVVLLFACVNPMIVSGLLLATATFIAACWAYRKIADGAAEREQEKLASATDLGAPLASRRDPDKTSAHAPWREHHATEIWRL
jgi:hypothetical protein